MAHIYAFGSVCRGEVTPDSDIDLLAVTGGFDSRFDSELYSVYSYTRISEIWREGNPFAWHLSLEARLLHSPDSSDYLRDLGSPAAYRRARDDCQQFFALFEGSANSLRAVTNSPTFELSTIFLAVRNFATCYSLGEGSPDFSRHSALRLRASSLAISESAFAILERARLLCTRGKGHTISHEDTTAAVSELTQIEDWMRCLLTTVRKS